MARRRGFAATLAQIQREAIRAQQAQLRAQAQAQRNAERARREYERAAAADERERKGLYFEARAAKVEAMNERLEQDVGELQHLLLSTLEVDDYLDFESLKRRATIEEFDPGPLGVPEPAPELEAFLPTEPTGMRRLFGKAKHQAAVFEAQRVYADEVAAHTAREKDRDGCLAAAKAQHCERLAEAEVAAHEANAEVDTFREEFEKGDPDAVVSYLTLVLQASVYPDGFPQHFRLAYVPDSKQLVVELELPPISVVPEVKGYRYVKARDEITSMSRLGSHVRSLYASVLCQVTLRTVHELYEADRSGHVETIVLNGIVDTVDPATGARVRPCLITLRTTRDLFLTINLSQVDPLACLRHLSASVSKSPAELAPVKPILEFDMVDRRFIEETDVLSELDQRPNLMDLSYKEFESLITNLFSRMGLEARQTQASRDGGVDCVAFDPRPIFGGKVVIQAKRYKNTVGVGAVRDLFGTMQNEGASKGILVTTSGYGSASYEFANGKPLELIAGTNLLYLLSEHTGLEARIQPPTDWADPTPEM
jgi:restriction system protein